MGPLDSASNLDVNPVFETVVAGTWTKNGEYSDQSGQTLLVDTNADFDSGKLSGNLLQANTNSVLSWFIVGNTTTNVTVLGDVEDVACQISVL